MKSLLLREMRRCAPWGLGMLTVLALLSLSFGPAAPYSAALALAALMGVVAVAPDTSSGGIAFLARLPLRPSRTIAVKALAATAYWVPAIGLVLATGPDAPPQLGPVLFGLALLGYGGFAFGAGLLASVVVARALPAVLVTPTLALTGFGLSAGVPLIVWRIPLGPFAAVAAGVMGATFVAVAGLAFARGDRHRRSFKPALIALGALTPLAILGLGTTGVAHAWAVDHVVPALTVGPTAGVASPDGAFVALSLEGDHWTGRERRVAIVSRVDKRAWVPDLREAVDPQWAPGSRHLLIRDQLDPGGWLVDLETREVRALHGAAPEGFGFEHAVWRDGAPFFVRDRGDWLEGFDPTQPCDVDPTQQVATARPLQQLGGWRLLGVQGERLVLSDPERGLALARFSPGAGNPCGLRAEIEPVSGWPSGMVSAQEVLSPDGRSVLALPSGQATEPRVWLHHLDTGASAWLQTRVPGLRLEPTRVSWSPGGRSVAIACSDGSIAVFDQASGAQRGELPAQRHKQTGTLPGNLRVRAESTRWGPVIWTPNGEALMTPAETRDWRDRPVGAALDMASGSADGIAWSKADDPPLPDVPSGVQVGDRYFVANHEGVVFYTQVDSFTMNPPGEALPDIHVCKGPSACYDPEQFHGLTREQALIEDGFLAEPHSATRSHWEPAPAAAAFVDGETVVRMFEPLSLLNLRTETEVRLLKGGE